MGEREEILKLVRGFREMQERLASEREARMDMLTQQTRKHLAEMYSRDITLRSSATAERATSCRSPSGAMMTLGARRSKNGRRVNDKVCLLGDVPCSSFGRCISTRVALRSVLATTRPLPGCHESPNRADTFLLDTATGKIWQLAKLTDMKGEPVVWQYMERLDNPLDVINLAGRLGWKAKEVASAPSAAAVQPSKRQLRRNDPEWLLPAHRRRTRGATIACAVFARLWK